MATLRLRGLIVCGGENFDELQVSRAGMDCAINVSAARNPVLLSLPRPDVPLHSMTLLELLHQMDEQGWECRRRLGDVSVEPY